MASHPSIRSIYIYIYMTHPQDYRIKYYIHPQEPSTTDLSTGDGIGLMAISTRHISLADALIRQRRSYNKRGLALSLA